MSRDDPDVIEAVVCDPATFVSDQVGLEVSGVDVGREVPETVIVLIPHARPDEEPDYAALDRVAGGGNQVTGGKTGGGIPR